MVSFGDPLLRESFAQCECLLTGCFHSDRQRLGISGSTAVQRYGHDSTAVHVHGVLTLVSEMSATVFHLGDLGVRIVRMRPIVV